MRGATRLIVAFAMGLAACSGSDSGTTPAPEGGGGDGIATQVAPAVAAVEAELGGPQEYFEITATSRLVNVFVALDDGTAVVPYVYFDDELQPPAPKQTGVVGQSFTADALDFDPSTILAGVADQLPTATIDALSIEGGQAGFVRYVASVRSSAGGVLDVVLTPQGAVIEVIAL